MNSPVVTPPRRLRPGRALQIVELMGPIAVILVAWASTSVRGTMAIANVALVMAAITAGIALVGWRGGLATSVAAALSLNYFHTEPVHSLRITETSDLIAVLLLATLGMSISAATGIRVRSQTRSRNHRAAAAGRSDLAASMSLGRPVDQVWAEAVRATCGDLALVDCKIEAKDRAALPAIARYRPDADESMRSFVLAEGGAMVPFANAEIPGVVVLIPRHGMGSVALDRRRVTAFVDQLEMVLSSTAQRASHAE